MSRHQKKIIIAAVSAAVIIACIVCIVLLDNWFQDEEFRSGKTAQDIMDDLNARTINGIEYIPKNVKTLLLIGVDTNEDMTESNAYKNNRQADFLLLVVFDKSTQKVSFIHLNRDTIAPVDELGIGGVVVARNTEKQLALAYAYGYGPRSGCENTKRAVSGLFGGLQIDYVISMNLDAVSKINDYVGPEGVELTLGEDEDLSNINSSWTAGSTIVLKGVQALDYIRARKDAGDQTNVSRMERQKKYMKALSESAPEEITETWIQEGFNTVNDDMYAHLSGTELKELMGFLSTYDLTENIVSPTGVIDDTGTYVRFNADKSSLDEILITYFYKERYGDKVG